MVNVAKLHYYQPDLPIIFRIINVKVNFDSFHFLSSSKMVS